MDSPEDVQLQRLMARDESQEAAAKARIHSQMPIHEKAKVADEILDNSGSKESLTEQFEVLLKHLERETRWTWLLEWVVPPLGLIGAAWVVLRKAVKRNLERKKQ